jgi:DNA polymerase
LDLPDVGAWQYAGEPNTGVWCAAYAVDDGPVQIWNPGQPIPEVFFTAARDPDWLIAAHNDAFERAIEERILAPRYGWPIVPIERHRCTMAMASASALPAKLKTVAEVLQLSARKDDDGARLMQQMARPRKPRAGEDPNGIYWHDDPEKLDRLYAYCAQDVIAERELYHRLPPLTDAEQALWVLDAAINQRGFHTDGALLTAASKIAAAAGEAVHAELASITAGALISTDQVAAMLAWLGDRDCAVRDAKKPTLRHALRRKDIDPVARRVIELRLGAAHAAAAKIDTLLLWRDGDDGRVRNTLRFHGAGTGRWTGGGPQPQNFKRDSEGMAAKIAAISTGDLAHVAGLYPQPLEVVGDIARAMISAAPGHRLLIGDFSGVESRVLAWVSGQQSKLDQWAKFDRTGDPEDEPYYLLGRGCGRPEDSARSIGKTADLAFGYMGGVGAWDRLAPDDDTSSEDDKRRYQKTWRRLHQQTVKFWGGINRAAICAVRKPGTTFTCRQLTFIYDGEFLRIKLPSGRALSYPSPRLSTGKYGDTIVIFKDNAGGKWVDCRFGQGAYGGLWAENIVQAVSRDLLAAAMHRLEAAGYLVTLHVHDEIVAEAPDGFGSIEEFTRLITALPEWAEGLPVAAKVRNGPRFAKSENKPTPAVMDVVEDNVPAVLDSPRGESKEEAEPPPWEELPVKEQPQAIEDIEIVDMPHIDLRKLFQGAEEDDDGDDDPPGGKANGHDQHETETKTETDPELGPYIYRDARGNPHAKVIRTPNGKSRFTQKYWDGKAWQPGMAERKLPYRLPELLAANPAEWICITEGEKDAVNVTKLGLTATTNPNGAQGWKKANLVPWFAPFSRIAIFEDNDDPGRERTKRIIETLSVLGPALDIRVVSFPELPEGEDVSDWLAQDRSRGHAELLARIEAVEHQTGGNLESVRASSIAMEVYDWLWSERFAIGEIGLVVGMPDEGKGQMLAYIASRVTNGLEWANGEGRAPQGNVILLTAEDDVKKTVVPRLKAAGADLDRIEIVRMMHETKDGAVTKRMFSLISDLDRLREKIVKMGNVKLVEIDPVSAYMGFGKVDSYRTTDVRAILGPLKDLAEELSVAIIGIMHFNKKIDVTNVLLRVSDSLAFVAAPRHVFGVIDDPDNGRKLVVRAKNNLAAAEQKKKSLAFHFDVMQVGVDARNDKPIQAPFIVWEPDYVDVTANEALSAASENKAPAAVDEAKRFLLDMLANGPVAKKEIEDAAEGCEISLATLRRAKRILRVIAEKDRDTPKGSWFWKLPPKEED